MHQETSAIMGEILRVIRAIRSNKNIAIFQGEMKELTMAEIFVLNWLYDHDNATMGELARYAKVKMPTMTDTITRLIKHGYVKRSQDIKDRRKVYASITPSGKKIIEKNRERNMEDIQFFLEKMNDDERKTILNAIAKFREVLESQTGNGKA